jgi:hypothetical protein
MDREIARWRLGHPLVNCPRIGQPAAAQKGSFALRSHIAAIIEVIRLQKRRGSVVKEQTRSAYPRGTEARGQAFFRSS